MNSYNTRRELERFAGSSVHPKEWRHDTARRDRIQARKEFIEALCKAALVLAVGVVFVRWLIVVTA